MNSVSTRLMNKYSTQPELGAHGGGGNQVSDSGGSGSSDSEEHDSSRAWLERLNTVCHIRSAKRAQTKHDTQVAKMKASFQSPKWWILLFGCVLAMCAGNVDVAGLKFFKICLANMTGNAANIGMKIEGVASSEDSTNYDAFYITHIVVSFVFGAFLCGLIIPSASVHLGGASFYGTALLGTSALLIGSGMLVRDSPGYGTAKFHIAACLGACACGLQNSMCTLHLGAVIRTTHVTGTLTDIGTLAGRATTLLVKKCMSKDATLTALRQAQLEVDLEKLFVLTMIFISFVIGCLLGAVAWRHHAQYSTNADTLFYSAGVTGALGFIYTFFREALKKQFQAYEKGRQEDAVHEVLQGAALAIGLRRGHEGDTAELDLEEQVVDELLEEAVAAQLSNGSRASSKGRDR